MLADGRRRLGYGSENCGVVFLRVWRVAPAETKTNSLTDADNARLTNACIIIIIIIIMIIVYYA